MVINRKKSNIVDLSFKLVLTYSFLSTIAVLYDIGFRTVKVFPEHLNFIGISCSIIGILAIVARYIFKHTRPHLKTIIPDILFLSIHFTFLFSFLSTEIIKFQIKEVWWIYIIVALVFIREILAVKLKISHLKLSPAQLFVLSFLSIIILGSILLTAPNATNEKISFLDALFTSTSAVCVTGLVVVDTGSHFSILGQSIILFLIQAGGIGIMTFATYFSFFFKGNATYESQIAVRELIQAEKLSEVFTMLRKVILITLLVEVVGALLIFNLIDDFQNDISKKVFFSIFHSVSAFCNAGFSTISDSFMGDQMYTRYSFHLTISLLLILGGLGFPIVFNLLSFVGVQFKKLFFFIIRKKTSIQLPRIISINSRIVLITSLILTLSGALFYYLFEYNNTLSEHGFWGKFVVSFFSSATCRTAGFNITDTNQITIHATLIMMFLMWVGASPGSTGGGIKTTTLAILILNIKSIVNSNSAIEIYKREITGVTLNRASAVMLLSIFTIIISLFFLTITDPDKKILDLAFECISAYSTVGLSRDLTASLSENGKLIIIATMFLGRINMLNFLIALTNKKKPGIYKYPSESLLIN